MRRIEHILEGIGSLADFAGSEPRTGRWHEWLGSSRTGFDADWKKIASDWDAVGKGIQRAVRRECDILPENDRGRFHEITEPDGADKSDIVGQLRLEFADADRAD
jgi:hypothetical protein